MDPQAGRYLRFLEKISYEDKGIGEIDYFEKGKVYPELSVEKFGRVSPQKLVDEGKVVWCDREGEATEKNPMEITKEEAIKENKKLQKLRQPIKETVDEDQIKLFWKFIVLDGRNHKFQVFKKDNSVSKEIDIDNVEKLIGLCKKHNLEGLTCLSVNPFKKGGTRVGGVAEITGILIDIDVKKGRKIGGVSTLEDKSQAKKTAEDVIKKLEEKINLRISLFVDSGNGYHIYIPIFINLDGFSLVKMKMKIRSYGMPQISRGNLSPLKSNWMNLIMTL